MAHAGVTWCGILAHGTQVTYRGTPYGRDPMGLLTRGWSATAVYGSWDLSLGLFRQLMLLDIDHGRSMIPFEVCIETLITHCIGVPIIHR